MSFSTTTTSFNERLATDRRAQGYSCARLAEAMLEQRPTLTKKRTPRALAVWLNRVELGKVRAEPSIPERQWIARTLFPNEHEQQKLYETALYEPEIRQGESVSELFHWLAQLPKETVVSGDYADIPLASYDSMALAMWHILLNERLGKLRLFVRKGEARVKQVMIATLRLVALHAITQNSPLPACNIPTQCRWLSEKILEHRLFDDIGNYSLPRQAAGNLLDRIVIFEHDRPEGRFNPLTWFLAQHGSFTLAGATAGNEHIFQYPQPEQLQRHFAEMSLECTRRVILQPVEIEDLAKQRGIQIKMV